MLQDALWADADRLDDDPAYRETAVKFVEASLLGWIHCRDNPEECVDVVLDNAPTLGRSHQTWQLNEISALIWPSPLGVGVMDPGPVGLRRSTVATSEGILASAPDDGAYRPRHRLGGGRQPAQRRHRRGRQRLAARPRRAAARRRVALTGDSPGGG